MTKNHAGRQHAAWSASASERLWACPGSLALNAGLPDKESEAAAWGTACHEVAEAILRGLPAPETVKTKAHEFTVDDEMIECAHVYTDYVQKVAARPGAELLIEQKFSLAALDPPLEAGGTCDAVVLNHDEGVIEVVDLKTGRGVVVEAVGNKQLRTYALGACLANPRPWKKVRVTIVQPRASHPGGRIRSEEFDFLDLFDWSQDLLDAMHRAVAAADNPTAHLNAGPHCQFCKAAATCPALAARALQDAQTYFEPVTGEIAVPPAPSDMTMDQIVKVLDAADMIGNWLNAVRAYAQEQAESGVEVPGYVLVPKRAMRKWASDLCAMDLSIATGLEEAEFYAEPKMKTPAQVEKMLGKKGFVSVSDLVVQESSGLNLTRADKTTRGAVTPPVLEFFTKENGDG